MCIFTAKPTETWSLGKQWPIKTLMIYCAQKSGNFFVNRARMFKHQDRSSEKNGLQAGQVNNI